VSLFQRKTSHALFLTYVRKSCKRFFHFSVDNNDNDASLKFFSLKPNNSQVWALKNDGGSSVLFVVWSVELFLLFLLLADWARAKIEDWHSRLFSVSPLFMSVGSENESPDYPRRWYVLVVPSMLLS